MDQQNKSQSEENQKKPADLSKKDLEQVIGGMIGTHYVQYQLASVVNSPRDPASGLPTGLTKPADLESVGGDLKI